MNKKYRNYFDHIENKKIKDKFIEHIIRLLFFTVILSIEVIFTKIRDIIFHLKNYLKGRTLSDVLKKYRRYKESINLIIHNHAPMHNLHDRIYETMNRLFNDEEKNLIFGIKDTTHNFLEKSKDIITSITHYTSSVKTRYFKYIPLQGMNKKNLASSMLTLFILKKYTNNKNSINPAVEIETKREYTEILASGYKKFIDETLNKFYSNDFKKKIIISPIDIQSLRPQISRIFNTIKKLEQKQIKYTFGQY